MTKKIDIKSLLIGFLLATSVMLFMGSVSDNKNGRFQAFAGHWGSEVYSLQYLLNTQTGQLYFLNTVYDGNGRPYDYKGWDKFQDSKGKDIKIQD